MLIKLLGAEGFRNENLATEMARINWARLGVVGGAGSMNRPVFHRDLH